MTGVQTCALPISLILWGIATELTIMALITYTPLGNDIFRTSPLPVWIFGPLALGAIVLLLAEEGRKIIANLLHRRHNAGIAQEASTS